MTTPLTPNSSRAPLRAGEDGLEFISLFSPSLEVPKDVPTRVVFQVFTLLSKTSSIFPKSLIYRRGLSVRRSLSTRSTPRILAPPADAMDTMMSMMDTKTRTPSRTFQLLCRYVFSPEKKPRATTCSQEKGDVGIFTQIVTLPWSGHCQNLLWAMG